MVLVERKKSVMDERKYRKKGQTDRQTSPGEYIYREREREEI